VGLYSDFPFTLNNTNERSLVTSDPSATEKFSEIPLEIQ